MGSVATQSTILADEYVPEVAVANELRGASNRVMYQMRGYSMTQDHAYFDLANEEIGKVEVALEKARKLSLAAKNLKALDGQLRAATEARDRYAGFMQDTEQAVNDMAAARAELDLNAAAYIAACTVFLDGQSKFDADLKDRDRKLSLIEVVQDQGTNARVANFKGQARNDQEIIQAALSELEKAFPAIRQLQEICVDPKDQEALGQLMKAGEHYSSSIKDLLADEGDNTSAIMADMDQAAGEWVESVEFFLGGQRSKLVSDMGHRKNLITAVNEVVDIGNDTRIKVFKAQSLNELVLLDDAR